MTTFSQSLKLELIGNGEQSGTWGQTTNKNLGTLLEQAITGVISITMLDTNYTLTSFNGVSDEARNAVIVVVGTNSAQRDIIAPLVNKIYTISNNTVGGYAIRIRGASGSAITIPNGVTASVYCNGSDFYNMQVGTTGNETINGNLTVTGTANIAGATTVGGNLSGTTANFSGAISSFNPSFTGVPTSPTAPNGTNTTQIATTAFVQNATTALGLGTMSTQNANAVNITGGTVNNVSGSNPSLSVGSATNATNATNLISGGTIASNVTATTQSAGTNNTTVATTAFVQNFAGTLGTMSTQNANSVNISGGTINNVAGSNPSMSVGSATNASFSTTQPVGTANTTIATTAFVNQIYSITPSAGYQKLASGLIIQWGQIPPIAANDSVIVTYPIAFPSNMVSFSLGTYSNNIGQAFNVGGDPNVSGSQLTRLNVINSSTVGATNGGYYIVIGY